MGRPLNEHDLADLGQDTVIVILRKLGEFAGRAPFEGWVYRVCCLEFLNGVRRMRKRPGSLEDESMIVDEAAETTNRMGERERVHAALEEVGGVDAETVRLKHFEDLTFQEMGHRMGMSPNTLKTRYYRGIERLERILARNEEQ